MKLYRVVSLANDQIQTERVAYLPYAAADGSLNSCFEVSLAETGKGSILAFFRTTGVQYMVRSTDSGKTWSAPKPFTAHPNCANAKADLARSPSGRLVLVFNRWPTGRMNMCIALSDDGGETWPHYYVFDDRKGPGTSYPNVQFGAGRGGQIRREHLRGLRPRSRENAAELREGNYHCCDPGEKYRRGQTGQHPLHCFKVTVLQTVV
jgi:hypothetical protein